MWNCQNGTCVNDGVAGTGYATQLECQNAGCCTTGSVNLPEIGCVKKSYLLYGGLAVGIWYFLFKKP